MAGAGVKLFVAGDVLTAAQVNTYLQDQVIMRFASSAARDAAFGGAGEPVLAEGMFCYLLDTNEFLVYTGAAWTAVDTSVDASKIPLSTVTTAGDLIVGTGNATVTRLAASTSGYVLTSNGTGVAPTYQVLPASGVTGDSDQLVLGSQVFS